METNNRRTFLRKAAFSVAALGALGSQLPAFGAAFVPQEGLGDDYGLAVTRVITKSAYQTYSGSYTIPDQEGVGQAFMGDDSPGSFLNLGSSPKKTS